MGHSKINDFRSDVPSSLLKQYIFWLQVAMSDFEHMVQVSCEVARNQFGPGSREARAVELGWRAVGLR